MKLQKKILTTILEDITGEIIYNIPNNILYKDLCKLYGYLNERKISSIYLLDNIKNYYKILFTLLTAFLKLNIYINSDKSDNHDWIINNNKIIDEVLSKKYKKTHISIKNNQIGNIYYSRDNNLYSTNWLKIRQFTFMSKSKLRNCFVKNQLYINNLDRIYYIYFLGYCFFSNYKIYLNVDSNKVNISDDYKNQKSLFISHKYTLNFPENYKKILFYSYNIGQFLLYNVIIDSKKIIGKLFSIFYLQKIKENNIIIFNGNIVNLPSSYHVLKDNIIMISKKTSKIKKNKSLIYPNKIVFSEINKFLINNGFIKRHFLEINYQLTKIQGYKIYFTLLRKFPELCSKYYSDNFQNIYLYNQYQNLENIIFSLILFSKNNKSTIIIDISYSIYLLEIPILIELDDIISNLLTLSNIKINNTLLINNYKYIDNKIHLFSEFKFLPYFLKILFKTYIAIINSDLSKSLNNLSKKQLIYEFDMKEIGILKNLEKKFNIDFVSLFRILLLKSIFKFFPNKIVLFMNNSGSYLISNLDIKNNLLDLNNILNILLRAKVMQSFTKSFIFKILNKSKYLHNYSDLFIQINELIVDNDFKYFKLVKINNNNKIQLCSSIISYHILNKNKIIVNLSFTPNNDKIKYVVPDILNL
jgi:hypothetical protein